MTLYRALRATWQLLPSGIRRYAAFRAVSVALARRFREHKQDIYTAGYFEKDVEPAAAAASDHIVNAVCRDLHPQSVVDVGCGPGILLARFAAQGVRTVGLEYSLAGCELARRRNVDARQFDIRFDSLPFTERFDLACCTEVAEHIPAEFADRLVDTLSTLGKTILFTAATPGQGGTDHVNEQPNEYWVERFERAGYLLDAALTETWANEWRTAAVKDWYWKNLMVFREV